MIQLAGLLISLISFSPRENIVLSIPGVSSDTLTIPVLNYEELKPMLEVQNDTTYLVNFWATWCAPCVKELPYFIQLDSMYEGKPFRLLLVSLDFKKDYLKKLQPFVRERGIINNVVVLEDNNANFWISDIESSWGGAIPATLVFRGKERVFLERTFEDVEQLSDIVEPFLNL